MSVEVINKILSKIGKKVNFTYPGDEGRKQGILIDRAVFESNYVGEVPYWDVVDLIEFKGEPELEFIRITYHRKKPGKHLNFSGQRSLQNRSQSGGRCSFRLREKRSGFAVSFKM